MIFNINSGSSAYSHIKLSRDDVKRINGSFFMKVDSPNVYIFSSKANCIVRGSLVGDRAETTNFPLPIFSRGIATNSGRIILRRYSNEVRDKLFFLVDNQKFKREQNISEINGDGGLITDGMLNYDPTTGVCIYVYYLKNRFLSFDTNLNLFGRAVTITRLQNDVNKVISIKGKNGERTLTLAGPRKIVNRLSAVSNGMLFVQSGLKSDNESLRDFKDNFVIDVYKIDQRKYLYSFYVPKSEKLLKDFAVVDNKIALTYNGRIELFQF